MNSNLIKVSEAASITGLSSQSIRNYIRQGKLTGYRIGGLYKVDNAQVLALTQPLAVNEHN